MLEGIDILNGDPSVVSSRAKDFWISELQMRLSDGVPVKQSEIQCFRLKQEFNLSTQASKVIRVLASGEPVSKLEIASKVLPRSNEDYAGQNNSGAPTVIDVLVCRIRKSLPAPLKINTIWGFGYQCPPETCAVLKDIMAGELNQTTGA